MKVLDEILESIADKPADDIVVGQMYTGVKIEERLGIALTLNEWGYVPRNVGNLRGTKVAHLARSWNSLEACIGTAAINALLPVPKRYEKIADIFKYTLKMCENYHRIVFVGFMPIVEKLKFDDKEIYVFERRPGYREFHDIKLFFSDKLKEKINYTLLPDTAMEEVLPKCDLAVITGSTFVNKTTDKILEMSGGYNMIFGPTTPMTPILFEYGADELAGTINRDANKIWDIISQGGGRPPIDLTGTADFVSIKKC